MRLTSYRLLTNSICIGVSIYTKKIFKIQFAVCTGTPILANVSSVCLIFWSVKFMFSISNDKIGAGETNKLVLFDITCHDCCVSCWKLQLLKVKCEVRYNWIFAYCVPSIKLNIESYLFDLALTFFLINLRQCSLSKNSYVCSCHTIRAGSFNVLFIVRVYGKVAQWLWFWAVNYDNMGSKHAEAVRFF